MAMIVNKDIKNRVEGHWLWSLLVFLCDAEVVNLHAESSYCVTEAWFKQGINVHVVFLSVNRLLRKSQIIKSFGLLLQTEALSTVGGRWRYFCLACKAAAWLFWNKAHTQKAAGLMCFYCLTLNSVCLTCCFTVNKIRVESEATSEQIQPGMTVIDGCKDEMETC